MGMLFMYNTICFVLFCFVLFLFIVYIFLYMLLLFGISYYYIVWYFLLLYLFLFVLSVFVSCLFFMSIDVYIAFLYVPCKSSHRLNGSLNFKFQHTLLSRQTFLKCSPDLS